MLSRYDRRQLEMISNRLQIDDPDFARVLRNGAPPSSAARTRRWPVLVIGIVGMIVLLAGLASGTVSVVLLGVVTLGGAAVCHRCLRVATVSDRR
jgi:Protein of unknown function (DUF3040)